MKKYNQLASPELGGRLSLEFVIWGGVRFREETGHQPANFSSNTVPHFCPPLHAQWLSDTA